MTENSGHIQVVFFHFLHNYMKERGRPAEIEIEAPADGLTCRSILTSLEVPEEMVEVVFINGHARGLAEKAFPGDRVAFVPPGTPGPYRVLLGMRGRQEEQE